MKLHDATGRYYLYDHRRGNCGTELLQRRRRRQRDQEKIDNPDENINSEGMPIVDEQVTITMMTRRSPDTAEDWNEVASMQEMERISNIRIDWGPIPWEQHEENRNLALTSGDYPEVLHRTGMNAVDIAQYGEQGTLIALNDVIDRYMPNLTALLDENEDIRKGLTFPDGNIYSLPTIYDPDFDALNMQTKMWVRQDWLDQFGMELPSTLEEFDAYLVEVKNGDPNGNGEADEIPYSAGNPEQFVQLFHSTFGIATRGLSSGYIDADESGALRFWPTADGYRDELEYLQRLYADGLIQQDIFTTDAASYNTLGQEDVFGAAAGQSPSAYFGREIGENYIPLPPLRREAGDAVPTWNMVYSPLKFIGQFVVTDRAEHPIEICRWADYFYGDEGARLFFMGIEGESYEETEDEYELLPHITDNPDGLSVNEALRPYVTYLGGSYPGLVLEEYFQGTESSAQAREGTEVVAPHQTEEVWPLFTYTAEEANEMSSITLDMNKLVSESQAKFITGEMPMSEWDTYVGQLEQMGLDRYLGVQQAAYDRYRG